MMGHKKGPVHNARTAAVSSQAWPKPNTKRPGRPCAQHAFLTSNLTTSRNERTPRDTSQRGHPRSSGATNPRPRLCATAELQSVMESGGSDIAWECRLPNLAIHYKKRDPYFEPRKSRGGTRLYVHFAREDVAAEDAARTRNHCESEHSLIATHTRPAEETPWRKNWRCGLPQPEARAVELSVGTDSRTTWLLTKTPRHEIVSLSSRH